MTGHWAVLYPLVAEAARRAGASTVGLVDVGEAAGPNLDLDRVGITYRGGPVLGDPSAPVQVTAEIMHRRPVPTTPLPEIAERIGIGPKELPEALERVDALPVVMTTWALARLSLEKRLRFLQALDAAATHRTVAWVSAEGVGVAPGVPTFGDRPASGHSILGVTLFDHTTTKAEGVGRCWSRGRLLEWF